MCYLSAIMRSDNEKGKVLANTMLEELSSKTELTEDDYTKISTVYANLRNRKAMDSISEIAIAKFPKGKMKQQALMNSFYDAKTLAEKETIFNELESAFGMSPDLTYAFLFMSYFVYVFNQK